MARFSGRTRGNYRHGYKACFVGPTAEKAIQSAKTAHTYFDCEKAGRKFSAPELLPNGQYRVIVT